MRNDVIHAKGIATIVGSVTFLQSYLESLSVAHPGTRTMNAEGKRKLGDSMQLQAPVQNKSDAEKWMAPADG